uniref:LanC-like protein 2 n=1 Tax=Aceria tosichella TaxID=561515 RepID=A0A6G1SP24_9ACAR
MPATNSIIDKRRSSRKRFRMGHRHDDNTNSGANEVRYLPNPYDDWDELANERLLAKIESEHPLHESIEEEDEGLSNDFNNYINPTRRASAAIGKLNINSAGFVAPEITTQQAKPATITTTTPTTTSATTQIAPDVVTHQQRTDAGSFNFAIKPDGSFDHVFERKIREQLKILISQHVKSEQIDCNDRSMYTGLPGISLLYHHLTTKQSLDTKFREELAAKATHHVNQYLVSIQTAHMHNSKCPSFLCGDLGIYTFCALARAQQRLHREMLTRTLSYPGPGVLSQSAPPTPGVLGSELASGQNHHHHHHHHLHNPLPFSGVELINSEPDTGVLLEKILELIKMQEQAGTPDELLYGRTGGLYAMLLIKQQLPKQAIIKDEHIIQHINLMLKSGQTMESFGRPLFYSWHGKEYVGAAHGYAGILYMLLEAHKYLNGDQLKLIKEAINFIQGIRYPSNNYPSSIGSQTDRLVHWCHGAPGVIHLLIKAYLVYREQSYLDSALACGDVIWQRGILKKGFSLCHGISGNAYAFLHLYQLTRDPKHLYRAGKFAQYYFERSDTITWRADSPASLFEGYAGLAYFLSDLLNPSEAKFPAFQVTSSAPPTIV